VSSDAATQPIPRTLWRDDLVAALTGGLLILGLFLDGWNHLNLQQGKAGDFFTPWHGLLYAGFNACAIWAITRNRRLRSMMLPSRNGAGRVMRAPQIGSAHVALLGLGLAGAGVIGDGVARAAGLVADKGAMQPPFDFLLFTGAGLIFAIALRAAAGQMENFGRRVAVPVVLGVGAAAAVVIAFGGAAATKSVDSAVRTIAAQPSVVQSAPRTVPAVRHARHAAAPAHARVNHRAAAPAHRARHASPASTTLVASPTAAPTTTSHGRPTVVVHQHASRPAAGAPRQRTAARPAPHRAARSKGSFQQIAIPSAPSAPTTTTVTTTTSSSASPSTPAATSPASSPTAAPTPTTSNPPATSPPATPPSAAKHGGQGPG
jgi:hypothetical protein